LTSLDPTGVFPDVPNFQSSMTSLARLTRELAFRVLRALAIGLGLKEVKFIALRVKLIHLGLVLLKPSLTKVVLKAQMTNVEDFND